MAVVVDPGFPNIVNITKRMRPDGSVETRMADTLSKELPMLEDIPWVEGNLPTGHRITAVNALPSPTYRRPNQGLAPVKGETQQYDETCGMLEAHSEIDTALADVGGNAAAYRATEDKLFLEGMSQQVATSLFYDNVTVNPERPHGLAPRYPKTTGYTASNYTQKVGTPGGSSCQSIWIVSWDVDRVFGIFPKGMVGGLQAKDLGERYVWDASNNRFNAYCTQFRWHVGFAVKDYRYAVRIQYDTTDATNAVATSKAVYTALETGLGTIWKTLPTTRIYWSRTARNLVAAQLANADARFLTYERAQGPQGNIGINMVTEYFLGIPTRITDSLVMETAIS